MNILQHSNIVLNVVTVSTIIAQSLQIHKLQQNNLLDSPKLRSSYNFFFFMVLCASIGMALFNWSFKDYNDFTGVFLVPVVLISTYHAYTSILTGSEQSQFLHPNLETTQLLVTSESTTPAMNMLNNTNISSLPINEYHKINSSKDISPISSLSKNQHLVHSYGSTRDSNTSFNRVKTPILATLLHSETVLAFGAASTESITKNPPTKVNTILSLFIITTFFASQFIYSVSILNTSLYTPLRKQFILLGFNSIVSLILLISNIYNCPLISIFTFPGHGIIFNSIIPFLILVQSLTSLIVLFVVKMKGDQSSLRFRRLSIYDSASAISVV